MHPVTAREPIFNIPGVIVATLAVLVAVHLVRGLLSQNADIEVLLLFAFIPARYDANMLGNMAWPGGLGADMWTFVSYALLHGDWMHLLFNAVWLLAFGTPLARRLGTLRFLAFCGVTAAAGAVAHLVTHFGQLAPMIGASAAISGTMSGAMRFAFQRGGPLGFGGAYDSYRVPALSLIDSFRDPRVLAFLAVWFGLNLVFGLGSVSITGNEQPIAWQAHVGGFVAGLVLFSWFDPVGPRRYDDRAAA
ncbi:rhomboid family intramembrane serine protease [Pseudorhodoplanes sp.]|uniref:rhomboid family intramembrane serine protease n=1 Tax=Pseudorhodoplanes sp. TaxID=1934341 RepID=UPI00391C4ADD